MEVALAACTNCHGAMQRRLADQAKRRLHPAIRGGTCSPAEAHTVNTD